MNKSLIDMVNLLLKDRREPHGLTGHESEELVQGWLADGYDPSQIELAVQIAEQIRNHHEYVFAGSPERVPEDFYQRMEQTFLPSPVRDQLCRLVSMGHISPLQREELVEHLLTWDAAELELEEGEDLIERALDHLGLAPPWEMGDPGCMNLH